MITFCATGAVADKLYNPPLRFVIMGNRWSGTCFSRYFGDERLWRWLWLKRDSGSEPFISLCVCYPPHTSLSHQESNYYPRNRPKAHKEQGKGKQIKTAHVIRCNVPVPETFNFKKTIRVVSCQVTDRGWCGELAVFDWTGVELDVPDDVGRSIWTCQWGEIELPVTPSHGEEQQTGINSILGLTLTGRY